MKSLRARLRGLGSEVCKFAETDTTSYGLVWA